MVGAAMRDRLLDRRPDLFQVVGQVTGFQAGLDRHHAAADIDADGGRNDRTFGRNHAADRRADALVDVRHRGNPLEDERKVGGINELLAGGLFELDAFGPGFDRHAAIGPNQIVGFVGRIAEDIRNVRCGHHEMRSPAWPQPAGHSLVILSSRGTAGPQEHRPVTERDLNCQSSRLRSRPPRALAQIYYDCLFPLDWTTSFFSDTFIVPWTCQLVNKESFPMQDDAEAGPRF